MRLKRETVLDREAFVKGLFEGNPNLTMAAVNAKVIEKFGSQMRPKRVYQIRDIVRTAKTVPTEKTTV